MLFGYVEAAFDRGFYKKRHAIVLDHVVAFESRFGETRLDAVCETIYPDPCQRIEASGRITGPVEHFGGGVGNLEHDG